MDSYIIVHGAGLTALVFCVIVICVASIWNVWNIMRLK